MADLEHRLTEQFCAYEMLAGGKLPAQHGLVRPEPPFAPFPGYRLRGPAQASDSARRPGILGSLWEGTRRPVPEIDIDPDPEFEYREHSASPLSGILAHLEPKSSLRRETFAQFAAAMSGLPSMLSFELVGEADKVVAQFVADDADAPFVRSMAVAQFKGIHFSIEKDTLSELLPGEARIGSGVMDFALKTYVHFPLTLAGPDPLTGIVAVLGDLRCGERAVVQTLFEPVRHGWAESLLRTVRRPNGQPVFSDSAELVQATARKLSAPLFAVVLRAAAVTDSAARTGEILSRIAGCLDCLGGNNRLQAREGPSLSDVTARRTRRFGMLLNAEELAIVANLPSAGSPKLFRPVLRTVRAPEALTSGRGARLGVNEHLGEARNVVVADDARLRHMHVIGASGMGKSTLMADMILQDMENGAGLAVIDPHGDLIETVAESIPPHRLDDVILLDPSDEDFPIAFNILSAHTELEKGLLASDLCSVFRSFATSWGDQMTAILSNAILAMLEHPEGGTLADLRRFLIEKPYRKSFLDSVADPEVVYFWDKQFPLLSGRPEASVVTRLNAFLRPKPIRFMVCQKGGRLDLARVMDESKILLVRLPFGLMGEENARLFGSLFVAKLHQLVMGRQAQRAEARKPFWLYVDECHFFMTDSMASILSGARKYGMGLILAHQGMAQIEQANGAVADALTTNAHIRACFRLGDRDAKRMAEGFSNFEASDLVSLPIGRAIGRVGGADQDFSFRVTPRQAAGTAGGGRMEEIRTRSRSLYGRPRAEVAAELSTTKSHDDLPETGDAHPAPQKPVVSRAPEPPQARPPAELPTAPGPEVSAAPSAVTRPAEDVEESSKGEKLHESLKRLLKLQAEGMNFSVLTEETVPGGRVDLVLRKSDLRIAIEISVGNDSRYEAKNLAKCLRAGFDTVCLVSEDPSKLEAVRAKAERAETPEVFSKLVFCSPREALELIVGWAAETESTTTDKSGWKVTTEFEPPPQHVMERIRREVDEAIGRAIRRKRSSGSEPAEGL